MLLKRPGLQRPAMAVIALVAAALVALWVLARSEGEEGDDAADSSDPALIERGRVVYAQHCAGCHGRNLEGQPDWQTRLPDGRLPAPPHDASGHTWHHPDTVLFDITKNGVQRHAPAGYQSSMPAFGGLLSDHDIWASLAYIKSTWPKAIQDKHAALNRNATTRR